MVNNLTKQLLILTRDYEIVKGIHLKAGDLVKLPHWDKYHKVSYIEPFLVVIENGSKFGELRVNNSVTFHRKL